MSFMDTYSGYNQIPMYKDGQDTIAFITNIGTYCYKVMSFGLRNASATYQRLVSTIFQEQIRRIIEVYIDDMTVKSLLKANHINHLEDAFEILQRFGIKLNLAKCIFGILA